MRNVVGGGSGGGGGAKTKKLEKKNTNKRVKQCQRRQELVRRKERQLAGQYPARLSSDFCNRELKSWCGCDHGGPLRCPARQLLAVTLACQAAADYETCAATKPSSSSHVPPEVLDAIE
jgi:hypothetical protein